MKTLKYLVYPLLVALMTTVSVTGSKAQQQLGTYLLYQQHPELINPAYVLSAEQAKVYTIGRNQWTGIDGAPRTFLMGGHIKTRNERSAVGMSMLYDAVGPERYTEINGYYGHSIQLTENDFLAGGVSIGARFYNVRFALLEESDAILRRDIQERVGSLGLSFAYYRPDQLYVGVSVPRFGAKQFEEYQIFRENYAAVGSYLFTVDQALHVKASTWVAMVRNNDVIANFSTTAYFNRKVGIGVNYGSTKDFGLMASFSFLEDKVKFGYGYQFGVAGTNMAGMRSGSHEASLSYHFNKGGKINIL